MAFSDSGEEDSSAVGMSVATFILVAFVVAAAVVSLPSAFAWEEQLEACRVRGILPSDCPDDDSYVGLPYTPPTNTTPSKVGSGFGVSSKSDGFGSSRLWVLSDYKQIDEATVCYTGYERRVFRHRGWTTYKDNKNTTVFGCVDFLTQKPINLVLASRWYK